MKNIEKLSLKKTLIGAFIFPWWYRSKYLKALFFPVLIGFIMLLVNSYSLGLNSFKWLYFVLIIFAVVYQIFAISCHRIVLSEFIVNNQKDYLRVILRVLMFLFWIIVLGIIQKIISLPFSITAYITRIDINIGLLPALYVISRLSLVFPSTAIDQPISLSDSWKKTKGVGWKMFVIIFLFPLVLFILLFSFKGSFNLTFSIIYPILMVITMFEVTALSLAYKQLVEEKEEPDNKLWSTAENGS